MLMRQYWESKFFGVPNYVANVTWGLVGILIIICHWYYGLRIQFVER